MFRIPVKPGVRTPPRPALMAGEHGGENERDVVALRFQPAWRRNGERRRRAIWTESAGESDEPFRAVGLDVPQLSERVNSSELDPAYLFRHGRIEVDLAVAYLRTEHRPDEHKWGPSGPRLRTARCWIRHRKPAEGSLEAGERLGQPEIGKRCGLDLRESDPVCFVAKSVSHESSHDDRVVVRPDRAAVIADGIVASVFRRHRPNAPARKHPIGHELVRDDASTILGDDTRPEQVSHVRGHRINRTLVAVETDDVVPATLVRPEIPVDARPQLIGFALESSRQCFVIEQFPGDLRDPALRVIDVTLNFHCHDRQKRDAAVAELDPVPRILPALVTQSLRRTGAIFDVSVTVTVAGPFEETPALLKNEAGHDNDQATGNIGKAEDGRVAGRRRRP